KPALVLDIDETSLSNRPYFLANDFGTIRQGACKLDAGKSVPDEPCGFDKWLAEHEAKAIDPTLKLFNLAKSKNVAVFFITGRHANERPPTIANLKKVGYDGWTELSMREPSDQTPVRVFKTAERAKIAARGFTIIANVGDQQSDLVGGYAGRPFRVPIPFYFLRWALSGLALGGNDGAFRISALLLQFVRRSAKSLNIGIAEKAPGVIQALLVGPAHLFGGVPLRGKFKLHVLELVGSRGKNRVGVVGA